MSAIFGLVRLDGAAADPADLAAMRAVIAHWGPDGGGTCLDGPVGFGQCLLLGTPEDRHSRMPRTVDDGRLTVTVEARIDNRDELLDHFDVPIADRPSIADSELVVLAYDAWGDECPAHLLGDWSCAVWDRQRRRLFLARDHHGNTALYYFHDGRRFAFASDRRALLALPEVPRRLNELYLAQLLVAWPAYQGGGTIYRDVHRVPPAHAMTVEHGALRTWRYWKLEDVPEIRLGTIDDYADGLRDHLAQAVSCRMRSVKPVAVALSGGLDSGAVLTFAARAARSRSTELIPLTSVPAFDTVNAPSRMVDELALAEASARACGLTVVPVRSEHIGPMEAVERLLAVHGEPSHAVGSHYWLIALLEAARERGAGVMLTAQNGNQVMSWNGVPSLASAWNALRGGEAVRAMREALRASKRTWQRRGARHQAGVSRADDSAPWREYSAINGAFAERIGLRRVMAEAGFDPWAAAEIGTTPRATRVKAIRPGCDINGARWAQLGAAFGLETRDPSQDIRLMAFALGIPDAMWRGPLDRWVLRHAMRGPLPDQVRLNTRTGLQAADLLPRLRAEHGVLGRLLSDTDGCRLVRDILDLPYLRTTLARIEANTDYPARRAAATILMRGLGAGVFLSREAWTQHGPVD